jgi:hypothetical protein
MSNSFRSPFTVIIDTAEQFPFDFQGLKSDSDHDYLPIEVPIINDCLGRHPDSLGDYTILGGKGRCHVERKSLDDAHVTILGFTDGRRERFESELANLANIECGLVIVECSFADLIRFAPDRGKKSAKENAKILARSVMAFQMDYRVQWMFAESRQMAQQYVYRWFWRFWEKNLKPHEPKKNRRKAVKTIEPSPLETNPIETSQSPIAPVSSIDFPAESGLFDALSDV